MACGQLSTHRAHRTGAISRRELAFFLRGPKKLRSHNELQFWREAPRIGLTGVAEIEVGERGVVAERVAYDLNLASDILCRPSPCADQSRAQTRAHLKPSASTPRSWHLAKLHKFTPLHHETVMTIQFSKQPIAVPSEDLPKMASGLVCRLVYARDDPGKQRIRMWLIDLDDAQLRSGLGLTVEDIAVLRTGTKTASLR